MEYVAYDELHGRPSIIVDGYGTDGTVMVLSHWKGSGTPEALKDDLSTMIAFRYLDHPEMHVAAEGVSNNHFDEDGLCGIWAVLNPAEAMRNRERIIDVASAGDFETWRDRDSVRISLALRSLWDEDRSPLPKEVFGEPYPRQAAAQHEHALAIFPELLDHPERFIELWADEDSRVQESIDAIAKRQITIEERPDIDLAVVRVTDPEHEPHPMAVHNATGCFRVLTLKQESPSLAYRYETWVDFRSRPTMPRLDFKPLAERLSSEDTVAWHGDDVGDLQPRLKPTGETSLDPERILEIVTGYLQQR